LSTQEDKTRCPEQDLVATFAATEALGSQTTHGLKTSLLDDD
jgi:hypothetical protein